MTAPNEAKGVPDVRCACLMARLAARSVTHLYDMQLRASGVEAAQFGLLSLLNHRPGASQASIGRAFSLDKTTLSRNFKVLEKKGWVERLPGKDQRQRGFRLTRAGRERLAAARPRWAAAQRLLQSSMAPGQWEEMWRALRGLTAAASDAQRRRETPAPAAVGSRTRPMKK